MIGSEQERDAAQGAIADYKTSKDLLYHALVEFVEYHLPDDPPARCTQRAERLASELLIHLAEHARCSNSIPHALARGLIYLAEERRTKG